MPLSTACPKPAPRWLAKAQRKAEEARQLKAAYAAVDRRDGPSCRVCGARVGEEPDEWKARKAKKGRAA